MVDTSLNKKYGAKASSNANFEPAPEGKYTLIVKDISDWKAKTQNIQVIQKDENGTPILNEKGEKIKELVENCTFYSALATLEIAEGEHKGKRVFYNLTTHPNMDFNIANFLYGVGLDGISPEEIKTSIGRHCVAKVVVETYEKTVQNKDTGLDEVQSRQTNKVHYFEEYNFEDIDETDELDIGL